MDIKAAIPLALSCFSYQMSLARSWEAEKTYGTLAVQASSTVDEQLASISSYDLVRQNINYISMIGCLGFPVFHLIPGILTILDVFGRFRRSFMVFVLFPEA